MGFVQNFYRHSIPAVLDGIDVLVTAQTGSAFRRFCRVFSVRSFLTASPVCAGRFWNGEFRGASSEGSLISYNPTSFFP